MKLQFQKKIQSPFLAEEDPALYIQPFCPSGGNILPGISVPWGRVQIKPCYDLKSSPNSSLPNHCFSEIPGALEQLPVSQLQAFSHFGSATGDLLISPAYIPVSQNHSPVPCTLHYSDKSVITSPEYYAADLTAWPADAGSEVPLGNIYTELTANTRTAYYRFTFSQAGQLGFFIDFSIPPDRKDSRNTSMKVRQTPSKTLLWGKFPSGRPQRNRTDLLYYYIETRNSMAVIQTPHNGESMRTAFSLAGNPGEILEVKISFSSLSTEQAKLNMEQELPGWEFCHARISARDKWNHLLGKVKVANTVSRDPQGRLRKFFYTRLCHLFTGPFIPQDLLYCLPSASNDVLCTVLHILETKNPPICTNLLKTQLQAIAEDPLALPANPQLPASALFVSGAMGLFPTPLYKHIFQIHPPLFEEVQLTLKDKPCFTIKMDLRSKADCHIQSITLNGRPLNRRWITYSEIAEGGILSLQMGSKYSEEPKEDARFPILSADACETKETI